MSLNKLISPYNERSKYALICNLKPWLKETRVSKSRPLMAVSHLPQWPQYIFKFASWKGFSTFYLWILGKNVNNLRTPDFANLAPVLKTLLIGAPGADFFFSPVERRLGPDPRDQGSRLSCASSLCDLEKVTLLFWVLVFLDAESQDS